MTEPTDPEIIKLMREIRTALNLILLVLTAGVVGAFIWALLSFLR